MHIEDSSRYLKIVDRNIDRKRLARALRRMRDLAAIGAIASILQLLIAVSSGAVPLTDIQINNNGGATTTCCFTQSEASLLVFGNTVLAAFNDSGSYLGGTTNHFTGYARSTDSGTTWTDLGTLPNSAGGDAGDPVLARNTTTGAIYLATLGFNVSTTIQLFRSTDGGLTFSAPTNATPGRTNADRNNLVVDNFAGTGNGNVYLAARTFDSGNGVFFFRSTDGGLTFGPNGGSLIGSGGQSPWVSVGPDHSVGVAWLDTGNKIMFRTSSDGGLTFGAPVTVTTLTTPGINGDLGLTGVRSGTSTPASFRTPDTIQTVVNPLNGQIYMTFHDKGVGVDKGDIYLVTSTNGGATWSSRIRVNSDLTLNDQWQPTITITPDGTKLGIFWYDRRDDPANNLINYYGRTCTITGTTLTCGADYRISDVSFLPEFGRDSVVNPTYMGDYDIAQADNSFFYVAWGDNRVNLAGSTFLRDPNVFFDAIALGPLVTVPEPASLLLFALGLGCHALRRRFRART